MLHEIYPHKFHIEYTDRPFKDDDYLLICRPGQMLVQFDGENITVPTFADLKDCDFIDKVKLQYLCGLDDKGIFTIAGDFTNDMIMPEGYEFIKLHPMRKAKPQYVTFAAMTAYRIWNFYNTTKFCSCCGSSMRHSDLERAMICIKCGYTVYPSIPPSVIVAIRDGERLLLTRYQESHNPFRGYSLVAGYIETGETPEDTIHREVMEEVGLKVKNITFFSTQPWPLSGALLLGYYCDLNEDGDIVLDNNELEVAEWISREDLPDRSSDMSLTSRLIEAFRLGEI